jgi:hypothetical protein
VYILALASPTYPVGPSVYEGTYQAAPNYLNGNVYLGYELPLGCEAPG